MIWPKGERPGVHAGLETIPLEDRVAAAPFEQASIRDFLDPRVTADAAPHYTGAVPEIEYHVAEFTFHADLSAALASENGAFTQFQQGLHGGPATNRLIDASHAYVWEKMLAQVQTLPGVEDAQQHILNHVLEKHREGLRVDEIATALQEDNTYHIQYRIGMTGVEDQLHSLTYTPQFVQGILNHALLQQLFEHPDAAVAASTPRVDHRILQEGPALPVHTDRDVPPVQTGLDRETGDATSALVVYQPGESVAHTEYIPPGDVSSLVDALPGDIPFYLLRNAKAGTPDLASHGFAVARRINGDTAPLEDTVNFVLVDTDGLIIAHAPHGRYRTPARIGGKRISLPAVPEDELIEMEGDHTEGTLSRVARHGKWADGAIDVEYVEHDGDGRVVHPQKNIPVSRLYGDRLPHDVPAAYVHDGDVTHVAEEPRVLLLGAGEPSKIKKTLEHRVAVLPAGTEAIQLPGGEIPFSASALYKSEVPLEMVQAEADRAIETYVRDVLDLPRELKREDALRLRGYEQEVTDIRGWAKIYAKDTQRAEGHTTLSYSEAFEFMVAVGSNAHGSNGIRSQRKSDHLGREGLERVMMNRPGGKTYFARVTDRHAEAAEILAEAYGLIQTSGPSAEEKALSQLQRARKQLHEGVGPVEPINSEPYKEKQDLDAYHNGKLERLERDIMLGVMADHLRVASGKKTWARYGHAAWDGHMYQRKGKRLRRKLQEKSILRKYDALVKAGNVPYQNHRV